MATAFSAAVLGLSLAACGSSTQQAADPVTTAPAASTPSTAPASSPATTAPAPDPGAPPAYGSGGGASTPAAAGGAGAAQAITVTESEFTLGLKSTSLPAGKYTITAQNTGHIEHALEVDGPGVSDVSTSGISPGSSATLSVTLTAGTYEFWCPVGDHKMEGMDAMVTVT